MKEQFGNTSEFTAMQHKIGEMARQIFSAESATYRIGRNIDIKEEELKDSGTPQKKLN